MLTLAAARAMTFGGAIMTVAALSACGSSTPAVSPAKPIPLESAWHAGLFVDGYGPKGLGPEGTTDGSTDPVQTTLAGLGMATADFGTGYSVHLVPNGDTLTAPAIDFCGADYPSEKNRVARRLVVLSDAKNTDLGVFTDAVEYDSAEHATAALDELRKQISDCSPHTAHSSNGQEILIAPRPTDGVIFTGLTSSSRRAVGSEMRMNTSSGMSSLTQGVWQLNGKYVVSLTFLHDADTAFTAGDQKKFTALAVLVAGRLADSGTA